MQKKNPPENKIAIFFERVSKLVEITFWFADPEDFKSSIKKAILMNITDGHCDDLEDSNFIKHACTVVVVTILLMFLASTMMIIMMKRDKWKKETSEIETKIGDGLTKDASLAI